MARLSYVAFFPPTVDVDVDRGLRSEAAPGHDAFLRTSRRVAEAFSARLRDQDLQGRVGEVRVFLEVGTRPEAVTRVLASRPEGFEVGSAALPPEVARLSPAGRALLALDVLHGVVEALAPWRDLDRDAVRVARDEVLASGLRFSWRGPARSSPDRRYTASPVFEMLDDGFGRVQLEVIDRRTGGLVARTEPVTAFCTLQGFKRSARTLRWPTARTLVIVPGAAPGGLVEVDLDRDAPLWPAARAPEADAAAHRPALEVVVDLPDALKADHEIRLLGGGPTNQLPRQYADELSRLLTVLQSTGLTWWSASAERVLHVRYDIGGSAPRVRLRRTTNRVLGIIERPLETFVGADARVLAQDDVGSLLDSLSAHQRLGPPPTLDM